MDTMIMKMPAVALRGMVILPGMVAHFDVSRAKSIKAVEEAMMDEQKIFLVAQKDVEQENPDIEDLFKIGIIAEVKQVIKLQNNIVRILVEGKERAELSAFLENPDYLRRSFDLTRKWMTDCQKKRRRQCFGAFRRHLVNMWSSIPKWEKSCNAS